jgi:very-short-patch-repair endonuclease
MNAILLARELRKNQTLTEQKVWSYLRNRKYRGHKFLRQHPFYYDNRHGDFQFFIVDFYCAELKWVLELDGKIHDQIENKIYDEERNKIMFEKGYKVIRIKNEEVLSTGILYQILDGIHKDDLNNPKNKPEF